MMRVSRKQSLIAFFLISCLLLLLHILIVLARNAQQTADQIQEKLGVFLYLRDDGVEEWVKLLAELEEANLHVVFFSKDDAFRLLTNKLPNILPHLEKYGITNPLPPTIYVTYKNQEDYETIKSTVARYEHIISNLDNLSLSTSFQQQTSRTSKLITLFQVLFSLCLFLIIGVVVMIGTVISYIVTTLFYRFQDQVELASLLGGSRKVILSPFLSVAGGVIVPARILNLVAAIVWSVHIDRYFLDILEVSFIKNYLPQGQLVIWFIAEIILLIAFVIVLADRQVKRLLKNA